jgi:hypothetical protein
MVLGERARIARLTVRENGNHFDASKSSPSVETLGYNEEPGTAVVPEDNQGEIS